MLVLRVKSGSVAMIGNSDVYSQVFFPFFEDEPESVKIELSEIESLGIITEIFDDVDEYIDFIASFSEDSSEKILAGTCIDVNMDGMNEVPDVNNNPIDTEKGRLAGIKLVESNLVYLLSSGGMQNVPIIYLSANPSDAVINSAKHLKKDFNIHICKKKIVNGDREAHNQKILESFDQILEDILSDLKGLILEFSGDMPGYISLPESFEMFKALSDFFEFNEQEKKMSLGFNNEVEPVDVYFTGSKPFPSRDWFGRLTLLFEFKAALSDFFEDRQAALEWFRNAPIAGSGDTPAKGFLSGPVDNARLTYWYLKNEF